MKQDKRKISKKHMPKDLRRITKPDGTRVWVTGGREFKSLAELNSALKIQQTG